MKGCAVLMLNEATSSCAFDTCGGPLRKLFVVFLLHLALLEDLLLQLTQKLSDL